MKFLFSKGEVFDEKNNSCNVLAQYATSAFNVPVGISEYELNNLMPDDYKSSMPTIREHIELICEMVGGV